MILEQSKIHKLENFMQRIKQDMYPEPVSEPHLSITKRMLEYSFNKYPISENSKILDVGCGQGLALEIFRERGFNPIGISLGTEDISVCRENGYEVYEMDQSFLDFSDQEFDFIWCRHCLEHSIFPFFTLSELFRVLKQKGYLYIEVPAPGTSCKHQSNRNHYSVLGKEMWSELITRTGFTLLEVLDISFRVPAGQDQYWAFIEQRP